MKLPTKAIIAAAGLGTRFLPQTKAMPKEMLPIIDKPVIQIIVEQLVEAGVKDVIIVTGPTKRVIEDHFDRSDELENELRAHGKADLAEEIKSIAELANFIYIRQKGTPKGTGRPVLNAMHLIDKDEPFFALNADDFFKSDVPEPVQLLNVYKKTRGPVIAFTKVEKSEVKRYGIANVAEHLDDNVFRLKGIIEKPDPEKSPSTYAVGGCYILTPAIFEVLKLEKVGVKGEIVLAEAMGEMAKTTPTFGCVIQGTWHDAGSKASYLRAVVDFALDDKNIGPEFRDFLKERLQR